MIELTDRVREILQKVDGLVDDKWDTTKNSDLRTYDGKACILGLVSFAINGTDHYPDYHEFYSDELIARKREQYKGVWYLDNNPDAAATVQYLAQFVTDGSALSHPEPFEDLYAQNDSVFRGTEDVHAFIARALSGKVEE